MLQTVTNRIVENGYIWGTSPLDEKPLPPVKVSTPEEIVASVARARAAQIAWSSLPVKERARQVVKAGRYFMGQANRLSEILHTELGKPIADTYAVDLGSSPEVFSYFTKHAPKMLRDEKVRFNPVMFPRKRGKVQRQPQGVVALLTPWNYPISIPIHNLVPALLAGNAVIMKPSEYAARSGGLLAEILAAQFPPGLIGLVQGDYEVGESLIRAGVDHVVFVGGAVGGRAVARTAADSLTSVALELGGKDAAIVLEDADLDRAVAGISWAGLVNAGQSCAAVERIYVVESIAEEFTAKLVKYVEKLRVGADAALPGSVEIGPLVSSRQLAIVEAHVNEAVAQGARVLCGGERKSPGRYYLPTVLTGVNGTMKIMQEETFGPVLPIQVVKDEAEVVRESNQSAYGLTGSVWTRNLARGERLAVQLRVGVATVNNHMFTGAAPQAVWNGRGNSGYGVQNSRLALESFTKPRLLAVDANPVKSELWWFPYDRALVDLGAGMLATKASGLKPLTKMAAMTRMLRGVLSRLYRQRNG